MIKLKNNTKTLGLRNTLFWDVDVKVMDALRSRSLSVDRAISRGNRYEFQTKNKN